MDYTFNWLSFVKLADNLLDYKTEEAYRSSISRAYYGIFCHIRWELENRGTHFTRERIHSQVIEWFLLQQDRSLRDFGHDLNRLRKARASADYDNSIIARNYAVKNLIAAHYLIDKAKEANLIHD
jgi:uncharacterized protein (UPF0332 family)